MTGQNRHVERRSVTRRAGFRQERGGLGRPVSLSKRGVWKRFIPVTAGRRMSATTAAELMTTPVLTVAEDDYPGDVAEGMADRGFKSV